jgi:hypothetical protein
METSCTLIMNKCNENFTNFEERFNRVAIEQLRPL